MKLSFFLILFLTQITVSAQVFDNVTYYKKYLPKKLHKDLDYLLQKFEAIHPDYFKEVPRDSVVKLYSNLKKEINKPLTKLDFLNLTCPVAFNVIKDGHNFVNGGTDKEIKMYVDRGGRFFPYPVLIQNRRLLVNSRKSDIPFHSEIVKINDVPAKLIIEKVLNMYNAESDEFEEQFMSTWFSSSYWGSFGGSSSYKIEYISREDQSKKVEIVAGKTISEIDQGRFISNKKNYSFYELPEIQAGVIEYNACEGLEDFRIFCDSVFTLINKKGYNNLIIDIRENTGGTTRLNDVLFEYITNKPITQFDLIETRVSSEKKKDFIYQNNRYAGWFKWYHYLYYPIYVRQNAVRERLLTAKNGTLLRQELTPQKPKSNPLLFSGNVFLIAGSKTYSSAACFAAACKKYNIVTVIGQETGEPMCFTADWVSIELPHTKLKFGISTQRFVLAGGICDGRSVIPDYVVENQSKRQGVNAIEFDFIKQLIQDKKNQN